MNEQEWNSLRELIDNWRRKAKAKIATGSIDMFANADGMRDCADDLANFVRTHQPTKVSAALGDSQT